MLHDNLLKLLDLEGKEAPQQNEAMAIVPAAENGKAVATSPTALRLDNWGMRRGEDALRESAQLQECLSGVGSRQQQAHAAADFHAAAFEVQPQMNEACTDHLRWEFVKQLIETPEYHELRTTTVLNSTASEIAAITFASQYAELRTEREEVETNESGKAVGGFGAEIAVLKHVSRAISEALKEVEEAREAAAAMGMGPGAPGSNDPKAIAALFKRVRSDPNLRRICELAGRFRRVAQSRQRRKVTHGLDDVVGVVMDADLGRLLPHELAKLAIPEFEDDTLRRRVRSRWRARVLGDLASFRVNPLGVDIE